MKLEKKHVRIGAALVVVAVLAVLVLRPDPVLVEVGSVARGALRVTIDEDGMTQVVDRYVLSAPVTGRLVCSLCEAGDSVQAEQVVAQMFPVPLDTRAYAEAQERVRSAEAARQAAEARVEQARARWTDAQRTRERLESVNADVPGAVSGQRLDDARTAEHTAALALQEAESALAAARAEAESARAALAGTGGTTAEPVRLRAPVAGRLLRVYEEHERIVPAGSPVMEIGDPERLEVVVDVLTDDAARLSVGARALVTAGPGADTVHAHVARIEPSAFTKVSPLGVEEQRVNVILSPRDETGLGDRYRVDVSLVTWESDDVLLVPVSALFRSGSRWSVFVVEDGTARLRTVELGHEGRTHAEVLEGLTEGERVILYPAEAVEDGVRVAPTAL